MDRFHIMVVDDDRRLRTLLRKFLSDNGFVVSTAKDAAEARATLTGLRVDLIVLDVMMPGESGLELTDWLRRETRIPVLLLTAMGAAEDRIAGLERGAADYLAKPFEPRELLLRIATILRRTETAAVEPGDVTLGDCLFDIARGRLSRGTEAIRLTASEAGLMRVFARNPEVILSRARLVRDSGVGGNERTIDVQVTRLRRKIEPDPKDPRYLQTVWGEGYVLRPDR